VGESLSKLGERTVGPVAKETLGKGEAALSGALKSAESALSAQVGFDVPLEKTVTTVAKEAPGVAKAAVPVVQSVVEVRRPPVHVSCIPPLHISRRLIAAPDNHGPVSWAGQTLLKTDPVTLVEYAVVLYVASLALPKVGDALATSLRGYAGDVRPPQALNLLMTVRALCLPAALPPSGVLGSPWALCTDCI